MLPKQFVLLFMFMLPLTTSFEMDLQTTSLKSEFSVKCFGIMQPLLQDIAAKKEKIDQFDEILKGKERQLASVQSKYDQVEIKLAVAEAIVREKERQMLQQTDLCNTHQNNSNVKDELLKAYRTQVQDKTTQIEQLQKEAKERQLLLNNCTAKSEAQIAEIEQLETVAQATQLKLEQTAVKINESNAQIDKLLLEVENTNEQLQNHKTQVKSQAEQIEMLQLQNQQITLKTQELESLLASKQQESEQSKAELVSIVEQRDAFKLQLDVSEKQINLKQTDNESLQTEMTKTQAQLTECQSQLDKLQSTNCYWFGNSSDVHRIVAPGISSFEVLCDSSVAGPGWTVIQRRIDGSENFYRNWSEYRNGFGNLHGEFFIGMEKLYRLTMAQSYELYIHLESFDHSTYYARYADFSVGSESESYALKLLGRYTGNATDGLYYARNRKFSTYDVDNDRDDGKCAKEKHGAWWYDRCGLSNLNGQYFNEASKSPTGIYWHGTDGFSFKAVLMMLRPKSVQYA